MNHGGCLFSCPKKYHESTRSMPGPTRPSTPSGRLAGVRRVTRVWVRVADARLRLVDPRLGFADDGVFAVREVARPLRRPSRVQKELRDAQRALRRRLEPRTKVTFPKSSGASYSRLFRLHATSQNAPVSTSAKMPQMAALEFAGHVRCVVPECHPKYGVRLCG